MTPSTANISKVKADTWFSRYIRLLYSEESNGSLFVQCSTCNNYRNPKLIDCGHYAKRQHLATRWIIENCAPQCKGCNNFEQGSPELMAQWLDKTHRAGTAERMTIKSRTTFKVNVFVLNLIAEDYKVRVNDLLKERGWENYKWW